MSNICVHGSILVSAMPVSPNYAKIFQQYIGVSAFANPDYKDRSVDRSRFESHVGGIMVEGEEMKDRWIRR